MQNIDVQVPAPPAPPAPPTPPAPRFVVQRGADGATVISAGGQGGTLTVPTVGTGPGGVPVNAVEMRALRSQRRELSNQLTSAAERRQSLVRQLNNTNNDVARQGLEERIRVLDQRIVELEQDISTTGRQVMAAPAHLQGIQTEQQQPAENDLPLSSGQMTGLGFAFIFAVLMPLTMTFSRLVWRRASRPAPPARTKDETQRLERIEMAVETMAVEIERVSEGQRFVTRLLSEGRAAQPVFGQAREPEAVPVPRAGARQGEP